MNGQVQTHSVVVGYMRKWGTGILYLLTLGLFGIGLIYDFWTLNSQISELNKMRQGSES